MASGVQPITHCSFPGSRSLTTSPPPFRSSGLSLPAPGSLPCPPSGWAGPVPARLHSLSHSTAHTVVTWVQGLPGALSVPSTCPELSTAEGGLCLETRGADPDPQLPRTLGLRDGTVALPHIREGVTGSPRGQTHPMGTFPMELACGGSCSYVCEEGACPVLRASGSLTLSLWQWVVALCVYPGVSFRSWAHRSSCIGGQRVCRGGEQCLPGLRLVCGALVSRGASCAGGKGRKGE